MFITNAISHSATDGFSPPPPGGGGVPLNLNFHNHCLLCLQHVDPSVLKAITGENPKGLDNFQPILQFLTGTVDPGNGANGTTKSKYYPVTGNLPPLCTLCYGILAELYKFYAELMEIQRKIQNQTEAARRIVKGTTRRCGMRGEFFNRLKIAGLPKKEIDLMEYFISNFHGLVMDADRKAVLPQLLPLNFNDITQSTSPIKLPQSPSSLEPYTVVFAEPSISNAQKAQQESPFDNLRTITITGTSSLQPPQQVYSNTTFLIAIPTTVAAESNNDYSEKNIDDPDKIDEEDEIQILHQDQTESAQVNASDGDGNDAETTEEILVVRGDHDPLSFEYEGDEEEGEFVKEYSEQQQQGQAQQHELHAYEIPNDDEDEEEVQRIAREILMEKRTEMILEQLEVRDDSGGEVAVQEDEEDVNYWKSALSSQVIMEAVDGDNENVGGGDEGTEEDLETEQIPVQNKFVEVIDLENDDDEELEGNGNANVSVQPNHLVQRFSLQVSPKDGGGGGNSLSSHPTKTPNKVPIFKCSTCGKRYHSNQRLKFHEQVHWSGGRPKPWKCQYCQQGFSVKKLLEQHERIHTGERPFTCEICGDSFRQSSTLYRHKTVHSNPKQPRKLRSRK